MSFVSSVCVILSAWTCNGPDNGEPQAPSTEYQGRIRESHQLDLLGKPVIITSYNYDEQGRLVREVTLDSTEAGTQTIEKHREYSDDRLVQITAYDNTGALSYLWQFQYGTNTLLMTEVGRLPSDSVFESIRYVRDKAGRIVEEMATQWDDTLKRHFEYDTEGRLMRAQQYAADGRLTLTNEYVYGSDTLADTVRFITPSGAMRTMVYDYDSLGNKTSEKEPMPDGSMRVIRNLIYDRQGNILVEENFLSGNRIDYLYKEGNLIEERHKVRGGRLTAIVYYE